MLHYYGQLLLALDHQNDLMREAKHYRLTQAALRKHEYYPMIGFTLVACLLLLLAAGCRPVILRANASDNVADAEPQFAQPDAAAPMQHILDAWRDDGRVNDR